MPPRRKAAPNLLSRLKGTVSLSAAGLIWEIHDVQADDMALVSGAALRALREVKAAFPELIEERGQYHAGGYETPDEDGVEEYNETPTLLPRKVGF